MTSPDSSSSPNTSELPPWLRTVLAQVEGLQFGVVQITVHDSRVVQVERTERVRFDAAIGRSPSGERSSPHPTAGGPRR